MPKIPSRMIPALRAQLRRITQAAEREPVERERMAQNLLGSVMRRLVSGRVREEDLCFDGFPAALLSPEGEDVPGAALYLHGGGYCCGDLHYARWFGRVLAAGAKVPVLCPAYRLAPEHPFPAAVEDALACYRFLLERRPAGTIALIGESAGGGLVYSLCLRLKADGLPLPGGLAAVSPWVDLTQSGTSYARNAAADPSMTKARLDRFSALYTDSPRDPLASPLFGDLTGLPRSLIFAGGDEILLSDAERLHAALLAAGCESSLTVAEGLWHAYVFYGLREREGDMEAIRAFLRSVVL